MSTYTPLLYTTNLGYTSIVDMNCTPDAGSYNLPSLLLALLCSFRMTRGKHVLTYEHKSWLYSTQGSYRVS